MEWMLSIGGIGVDAPEASGGGFVDSSAIVSVGIGTVSEYSEMMIVFN